MAATGHDVGLPPASLGCGTHGPDQTLLVAAARAWDGALLPVPLRCGGALVCAPDDPWWEDRVLHAKLYPAKGRRCDLLV